MFLVHIFIQRNIVKRAKLWWQYIHFRNFRKSPAENKKEPAYTFFHRRLSSPFGCGICNLLHQPTRLGDNTFLSLLFIRTNWKSTRRDVPRKTLVSCSLRGKKNESWCGWRRAPRWNFEENFSASLIIFLSRKMLFSIPFHPAYRRNLISCWKL